MVMNLYVRGPALHSQHNHQTLQNRQATGERGCEYHTTHHKIDSGNNYQNDNQKYAVGWNDKHRLLFVIKGVYTFADGGVV